MFIEDLVSSGATPTLERMLRFTEARQNLLTEDVANVSTPNYKQKDLSVAKFQRALQARIDRGEDPLVDPVDEAVSHPEMGVLSHDGNNRSMENLMSEGAKNALMHNTVVELLRRQYQTMELAIRGQVS